MSKLRFQGCEHPVTLRPRKVKEQGLHLERKIKPAARAGHNSMRSLVCDQRKLEKKSVQEDTWPPVAWGGSARGPQEHSDEQFPTEVTIRKRTPSSEMHPA